MADTLAETIKNTDLPGPVEGEAIVSYARRVATVGAHIGAAWAMAHIEPAIVAYRETPEEEVAGEPANEH